MKTMIKIIMTDDNDGNDTVEMKMKTKLLVSCTVYC